MSDSHAAAQRGSPPTTASITTALRECDGRSDDRQRLLDAGVLDAPRKGVFVIASRAARSSSGAPCCALRTRRLRHRPTAGGSPAPTDAATSPSHCASPTAPAGDAPGVRGARHA
jgi:hypothetical protein